MIRIYNFKKYDIQQNGYNNKIISHFVSDFTDESLNKLNLKSLACLIEPDTIIVTVYQ